jgi:phosphohistidine phosphatase SixA
VSVYLVRHAKAGSRSRWSGPDSERPLSKAGRRQAKAVAAKLRDHKITRVLSSPYVRCTQTVEPLAKALGVEIEATDALAEGTWLIDALRLVEKVLDQETVLCSHGDIIPALLDHYARAGIPLDDNRMEKGSIWVLEVTDGEVVAGHYLPAPS